MQCALLILSLVAATPREAIEQAGKNLPDWWNDVQPLRPPAWRWSCRPLGDPATDAHTFLLVEVLPHRTAEYRRRGIKMLYQALEENQDNKEAIRQIQQYIARLYAELRDWPRAAYFWLASGRPDHLQLARCYLRMGARNLALGELEHVERCDARGLLIRLYGELGMLDKALGLLERARYRDTALLAAADACIMCGRFEKARELLGKVYQVNEGYNPQVSAMRADGRLQALEAFRHIHDRRLADGLYRGSAEGFVGTITVAVRVAAGRIKEVKVLEQQEDRPYSALEDIPSAIVEEQRPLVDAVSGATVTSEAIMNAAAAALAKAAR